MSGIRLAPSLRARDKRQQGKQGRRKRYASRLTLKLHDERSGADASKARSSLLIEGRIPVVVGLVARHRHTLSLAIEGRAPAAGAAIWVTGQHN